MKDDPLNRTKEGMDVIILMDELDRMGTEPCLCGNPDKEASCPNCNLSECIRKHVESLIYQNAKLRKHIESVCELQEENYGNGTRTHMRLAETCDYMRNEMENMGNMTDWQNRAVDACEGAPVKIERGSVVALATALDDLLAEYEYIAAESDWDMENWDTHEDYLIRAAEEALRAYWGETNQ